MAPEADLAPTPETTAPPAWPQSPAPTAPTWQENSGTWFRPENSTQPGGTAWPASPTERQDPPGLPPLGPAPGRPPGPPCDPGENGRRSSRWPVVLGIVVIVALGGTAAAVIAARAQHSPAPPTPSPTSPVSPTAQPTPTTTSPSPSPAPLTQQQAAQNLSALLSLSVADRGSIVAAAQNVSNCGSGLAHDATTFTSAAKSRQALLSRLTGLSGRSTLSASMLSDLQQAWQASQQADQDLAAWAKDESQGCSTNSQNDPNYNAADAPDHRATHFKKAFVRQWNPIAAQYSLPGYKFDQL